MKLRGYKRKHRRASKWVEKAFPNGNEAAKQSYVEKLCKLSTGGKVEAKRTKRVRGTKLELTDEKVDEAIFERGHGSRTTLREAAKLLGVHHQRLRRFVRRPQPMVTDNYQHTSGGVVR